MPILNSLSFLGAHFSSPSSGDYQPSMYAILNGSSKLTGLMSSVIADGDFTFELWTSRASQQSDTTLITILSNTGRLADSSSGLAYVNIPGGHVDYFSKFVPADGAFHHVVMQRASDVVTAYVDGVLASGSASDGYDYSSAGPLLTIGCMPEESGSYVGNIASVRASSVARYSGATITVPSAPFVMDGSTLMLALNQSTLESGVTNYGATLVGIS
jgi:hypothetical protein